MTQHATRRQGTRVLGGLATAALAVGLVLGPAAPAGAVGLSASKTSNLNPAGETIGVNGSGYAPGIQVYVALCNPAAGPGAACDMAHYRVANVDGGGSFSTALTVYAQFGATDCMVTGCAVQTSRVGMGADRSQEGTVGVRFAAPAPPPPPPVAAAPAAGTPAAGAPGATALDGSPITTTTAAPADTTTTTKPEKKASETKADARDAERAGATVDTDDDGGSSALPWIVGLLVVLAAAGGAFWFFRHRGTPPVDEGA